MLGLSEVKLHLRVDHSDEDSYLTRLIRVAREYSVSYCNRSIYETPADLSAADDPTGIVVNDLIEHAELMMIAHWYRIREAVSSGGNMTEVPVAATMMLNLNRNIPL